MKAPKIIEEALKGEEPPSPPVSFVEAQRLSTAAASGPLKTLQTHPRWGDWRWQMKNRIRQVAKLKDLFPGLKNMRQTARAADRFPLAVTPYYASLIARADASDPIFQMCVPQPVELCDPAFLKEDPLEENDDMPVPGLVHRYPDRALFIVTTTCAAYCRHCTRKRVAGMKEASISPIRLRQVVAYLSEHPEIRDVIVSGGDPFTMSTERIESVLSALRSVPSVEIIRIGTRVPVVLPQRITEELTRMLRHYHPLWVNTHFNHPAELTPEAAEACARLADAGIPLGNQSVLLRGVNDTPEVMAALCRGLVRIRVRPYYLFQCDLVRGVEHFRTPVSRGIEIMEHLRGRLSGLAIPSFVVDAPHGGGKIPLLPNYMVSMSPTHTVLRNFEGLLVSYPEPRSAATDQAPRAAKGVADSVWDLASGQATNIVPDALKRHARRSTRTRGQRDGSRQDR